jgi:membrane protein DedA with SNARE-associated domain
MNRVWQEMIFTFWLACLGAMIWVTVIFATGVKTPDEVIADMTRHLEDYGTLFITLDFLVGFLLLRWGWLWWAEENDSANDRLK